MIVLSQIVIILSLDIKAVILGIHAFSVLNIYNNDLQQPFRSSGILLMRFCMTIS